MLGTREPQQERSRVTRANLLTATIDCLSEVGLTGTTVGVVAARAGVSRGAAQHHFATRDDMIAAASVQVVDDLRATIDAQGAELTASPSRTSALLRLLLEAYAGTAGRAATALWVAAANETALRDLALPLERAFSRQVREIVVDVLGSDESLPGVRDTILLTLTLLRGIGLSALVIEPGERWRAPLEQWAEMFEQVPGAVAR